MDKNLEEIKSEIYNKSTLEFDNFQYESESKDYSACRFTINGRKIINRNAKSTPKKVGQFVTFWKRNGDGCIEPFCESDQFDFFIVNVRTSIHFGQFVFPKNVLIQKSIISSSKKEGKRAFRVYPSWDVATNNQAKRTQQWQLNYFYEIGAQTEFSKVIELYK